MQKIAFITGTGRGIGTAIAKLLLSKKYHVFGFSRTNTIKDQNFTFTKIDLSNLQEVQKLKFPKFNNRDILLINNAARIGEIVPLNQKKNTEIITDYNLNIISPTILCSKFINLSDNNKKMILNIGSGAANSSIACWSTYCATKSALDRLTAVIAEEKHSNLTIFSVHPGIVDTQMQEEIRNANLFPLLSKFNNYHANNELEDVKIAAHKLLHIIENYNKYHQNILSIRDINLN